MIITDQITIFNEVVVADNDLFKHVLNESIVFADKLLKKNNSIEYYNNRRNATKPYDDIVTGKMGEFFAALFNVKNLSYPFIYPDFGVYDTYRKSWSEDLYYSKIDNKLNNFHVKTCDFTTKKFLNYRDISWTFQKSNNGNKRFGRDSIYKELKNDIIIFVYLNNYNINEALINFLSPWKKLKPFLKDPVSTKLKGIKECIYFKDVLEAYDR